MNFAPFNFHAMERAFFVLTYAYDYFFQERARLEMERLAKHEEDLRLHAKKHDERRERKERERERREEERKQKELERIGNFFTLFTILLLIFYFYLLLQQFTFYIKFCRKKAANYCNSMKLDDYEMQCLRDIYCCF